MKGTDSSPPIQGKGAVSFPSGSFAVVDALGHSSQRPSPSAWPLPNLQFFPLLNGFQALKGTTDLSRRAVELHFENHAEITQEFNMK